MPDSSPLHFTPDDQIILENLQLERLRHYFDDLLSDCLLFRDRGNQLVILADTGDEVSDSEALQKLAANLPELKRYVWLLTGATIVKISGSKQPTGTYPINSADRKLSQADHWDLQSEDNPMPLCEVFMPTLTQAPSAPTLTNGKSSDRMTTSTGQEMLAQAADLVIDQIPETALESVLMEKLVSRMQPIADRLLSNQVPARQTVAPAPKVTPAKRQASATAVASKPARTKAATPPVTPADVTPMAAPVVTPSVSDSATETEAQAAEETDNGNPLRYLKISLSSPAKTVELALEVLAPGKPKRQARIAQAIIENRRSYRYVMPALLALYEAKGKTDIGSKISRSLRKGFQAIMDKQPSAATASPETATAE